MKCVDPGLLLCKVCSKSESAGIRRQHSGGGGVVVVVVVVAWGVVVGVCSGCDGESGCADSCSNDLGRLG